MTIQQASEQIQSIKNQLRTAGTYETAVLEARLYDARMFHLQLLKGTAVEFDIRKDGKVFECEGNGEVYEFRTRKAAEVFRGSMLTMIALEYPERLARALDAARKIDASAARARANARARSDAMRPIGMTKTRYGWE